MSKVDVDRLADEVVRGAKAMFTKEMIPIFERLAVLEKRTADLEASLRDRS